MKKHSKAVERHPAETIGIGLGDKMSRYLILNQEGLEVEEGSFRNHADSIAKHFGNRGRARVAVEVGTQSAWIAREFSKLGHEVIVANARELKWITSSDVKNDRNDARKLARLARADRNLLAPVEHRTAEQRAELAVIRARDALVRSRSLLVNTARSIAKGFARDHCDGGLIVIASTRREENISRGTAEKRDFPWPLWLLYLLATRTKPSQYYQSVERHVPSMVRLKSDQSWLRCDRC